MYRTEELLLSFGAPLQIVGQAVTRARSFLRDQAVPRTIYKSCTVTGADLGRHASGTWLGSFTMPPTSVALPYTPILLFGPVLFPLNPAQPVDFTGTVDWPFISMDGWAGYNGTPGTDYSSGGTRIGSFFVLGEAPAGTKQFLVKVPANGQWQARVTSPPASGWSFQLVTYATQADHDADTNRILIGNPWLQSQRPGDVRQYTTVPYVERAPQFTGVTITRGGTNVIAGTLAAFAPVGGKTYKIVVTEEVDVEYCWAIANASAGAFSISRAQPLAQNVRLRLVEMQNNCSQRIVGPAWCSPNTASDVYPDLRTEYRAIVDLVPYQPTAVQPARRDGMWNFTLQPVSTGQVRLVNADTHRIYGQYAMPSGFLRSFNVPAAEFTQNIESGVYYDQFNDVCFLYDQGVALIAMLQTGEQEAARKMIQAMIDCQRPDGSWVFGVDQAALLTVQDFIRNGAVAWVVYSLLLAMQPAYAGWALPDARVTIEKCLAFLTSYKNAVGTINGGKGDPSNPNLVIPWWSSEHNFDCWWVFDLAAKLYGGNYRQVADGIKTALLTPNIGWDESEGIFWQGGTVTAGVNTPDGMHALDMHSWGGALLEYWGYTDRLMHAIDRAYDLYYLTDPSYGWSGFTTFVPEDGYPPATVKSPWYEGSFGCVIALRLYDVPRALGLMMSLSVAQLPDGSYHYALQRDPVNGIETFPSLIAAAWNICAYAGPGTPYTPVMWTA